MSQPQSHLLFTSAPAPPGGTVRRMERYNTDFLISQEIAIFLRRSATQAPFRWRPLRAGLGSFPYRLERLNRVESRCGAAAVGRAYRFAAPFVRRCLSGSTVAPFPHPAHRTGHADLSGSSAIAGFRPHGSHRAALPQWALQKGPEAGRSVQPCLVDRRFREGKGGQELAVGRPVHAALLAAFAERLAPVPGDAFLEHAQ